MLPGAKEWHSRAFGPRLRDVMDLTHAFDGTRAGESSVALGGVVLWSQPPGCDPARCVSGLPRSGRRLRGECPAHGARSTSHPRRPSDWTDSGAHIIEVGLPACCWAAPRRPPWYGDRRALESSHRARPAAVRDAPCRESSTLAPCSCRHHPRRHPAAGRIGRSSVAETDGAGSITIPTLGRYLSLHPMPKSGDWTPPEPDLALSLG